MCRREGRILSITLQYRVNERYVRYVTDRDKYYKNKAFSLLTCIRKYVRHCAAAHFDLGFDVNWSTFDEDIRAKTISTF